MFESIFPPFLIFDSIGFGMYFALLNYLSLTAANILKSPAFNRLLSAFGSISCFYIFCALLLMLGCVGLGISFKIPKGSEGSVITVSFGDIGIIGTILTTIGAFGIMLSMLRIMFRTLKSFELARVFPNV